MDFKTDGTITVDKIKKKKIKCYKFHCKPLDRYLMVHTDIDNNNYTVLSDFSTGYRLFKLQITTDKITPDEIKSKLEKYLNHFTIEGIKEEIDRLKNIELELAKPKERSSTK